MKYTPALLLLVLSTNLFAQNHRYERYDGPRSLSLGFKALLLGGLIWGVGMLLGTLLKKNESGTVADGQGFLLGIVGILCVGGGLIVAFGLIMFGF
jgi:hypothetical protein